jgi:hypothetical protein
VSDIVEVPDVDPTELGGQVDEVDGEASEADVPELNVDDFANHYVTVKVDGEDVKVPLSEAVAGYSRQADYTRKTQELAEQRQQLQWAAAIQQALDSNPSQTIDLLANHYGISRAEAKDLADDWSSDSDEWSDPLQTKMSELDNRIRAFEEQQAYAKLERDLQSLQDKYGDDFNASEVVATAMAQGTNNLEAVYKQIAFDRVAAKAEAAKRLASDKAAQEKEVIESKKAAATVSGGSSAKGGKEEVGPIRSISDAWAAAKKQYGVS